MDSAVTEPVYVGLGSNLGDSIRLVREAMDRLEKMSQAPLARSSLWRTSPVDCPPGSPPFINAVVRLVPRGEETPEGWLARLQALECEFGRRPKLVLNEARPLDLDLLAWGERRRNLPGLILPHPRAHLRRFVLAPLAELAADWRWPGQLISVRELLERLPADEAVTRLDSPPGGPLK